MPTSLIAADGVFDGCQRSSAEGQGLVAGGGGLDGAENEGSGAVAVDGEMPPVVPCISMMRFVVWPLPV